MKLLIQSQPMQKWDKRFCKLARFVSEWSKDPNAKVGAVVFSKRGGIYQLAIMVSRWALKIQQSGLMIQK